MRQRLLGRSGLRVSEVCLGTQTFGGSWGDKYDTSKENSRQIFERFLDLGGNFIDTAYVYNEGNSEILLGEFIAGRRDDLVIASKYTPTLASEGKHGPCAGNGKKNMIRSIETTLKRLKTDHVDLYYLHWWDGTAPVEEIMRGLDDLVTAGKVLYVGISDTPAWQISRANMLAELRGWSSFISVQGEYHLLQRTAERELLPMAQELDLTFLAWSPLAGGLLTGKYLDRDKGGRYSGEAISKEHQNVIEEVMNVARELSATPAQVALAAIRSHPFNQKIVPVLGARSIAQLDDTLGNLGLVLTDDQRDRLDAVSAIELGFPHDFLRSSWIREMYQSELLMDQNP